MASDIPREYDDTRNFPRPVREDEGDFGEEFYKYFDFLLQVDVPKDILFSLWGIANRTHQVTKFDDKDIRILMREIDKIFTLIRFSVAEYEYDYTLQVKLEQMQLLFYSMIKRSHEGFERKMEATQIRLTESIFGEQQRKSPSVISRAAGFLGMKPKPSSSQFSNY